ncbi:protein N-lysine methyltransferase METTL21D-like [Daphnia pulex]|uniref:protein N-lysine methyltransferase METTL21D-like n=1 Tax=Daphnia pulex TaxID=6669 RepID=UPI001EDD7304|nr:protein N-lysine methyltransferase METTL21D-like [Daphnia pulex]
MEKYFSRDFHVSSSNECLEILQHTVGDVGCVVWDAALVLGAYLDHMNETEQKPMKNLKILELGSGTGFVGLVAAAMGGDCLITDLPEMIPLMKRNISKNAASLKGAHSAKAFEWGSDISSIVPNSNEGFHIVLAADCIYYKESLDAFVKTLEDLSSHCNGGVKTEIYISYEDRESEEKKSLIYDFFEKIKKTCNIFKIPFEDYREDFRCEDIHIFKITSL